MAVTACDHLYGELKERLAGTGIEAGAGAAAGPLVMATARRTGAAILPVDSEHSAVFQALRGEDPREVERLILTASGGCPSARRTRSAIRRWPWRGG